VMVNADERDSGRKIKKFIATTTYGSSFEDYALQALNIQSCSPEEFRAAFERVDEDKSGYIDTTEVRKLLRTVYKKEPPTREVLKFIKLFDENDDGKVSWPEFERTLEKVAALNKFETKTGSGRMVEPGWQKAQQIPRKVLRAAPIMSSYQADLGKYGQDPATRQYMSKTGMASTTGDLNCGTTKDTYRVPGYAGFIPKAKNNADAATHGDGASNRQRGEDLRLYHQHNMPGYTGHKPVDCFNDFGERQSGCDHRTTSGAAALGL